MEWKGKLSLILMLFGILLTVRLLESTRTFSFAFADTNLEFAVSECPVGGNDTYKKSGHCPDMRTIQNEDNNITNEQSDSSIPVTSEPVNRFGP
jgi:hypothetical protein